MKKAGRPRFQIDRVRLRKLREDAGLTQEALGEFVVQGKASKPDTKARSYQRIEATGRTSRATANRLAEGLAVPLQRDPKSLLTYLCGGNAEPPRSRQSEIEAQLRNQLAKGVSDLLRLALQGYENEDDPVKTLANSVAAELEIAQFEQRHEVLKDLAALTGWSQAELQRPTSLAGYWLLITNTRGYRETQIVLGVSEVLDQIETKGAKWLDGRGESDTRADLSEDASWLRFLLQHPLHPSLNMEFSFVRCLPSASGLQWVKPTEWDRWSLHGPFGLVNWAFRHVNFVKDFQSGNVWPKDLRKLRLKVDRDIRPDNPEIAQDSDWRQTVAIHKGDIDELTEETLDLFRADGAQHDLVTNWLSVDLWDKVLNPLMAEIPPAWWVFKVCDAGIEFRTEQPDWKLASQHGLEPGGRMFLLSLTEEDESGELHSAPWRAASMKAVVDRIQKDRQREAYNR